MRKVMIVEDEELILQGIKNIVHWNELELQTADRKHWKCGKRSQLILLLRI